MAASYQAFKATQAYHANIAQLFWAIEQAIINPTMDDWDAEYLTQCVQDTGLLPAYAWRII